MKSMYQTSKEIGTTLLLFFCVMLYKLATDFAYCKILIQDTNTYGYDLNVPKYILGIVWCIILFWGIRHEKRQASTFMLFLTYIMQIIPITTIYSCANEDSIYYNSICVAFLLCELLVGWINNKDFTLNSSLISSGMVKAFICGLVILVAYIVKKNGAPSLIALDIYKVYELRGSGQFVINKYFNYLLTWMMAAIVPFLLAKKVMERSYISVTVLSVIIVMLYLYTGLKGYLFGLPTVIICTLWSKRRNFYNEIYISACLGFLILVLLMLFSPVMKDFFGQIYSLFGRRLMMVPANNKFNYYDFFSNNPKMGLGGVFPRWLIHIPNYYENIHYGKLISEIYYGKPEMNSNTGFFAEGYMRFGHLGTLGVMMLYGGILRLLDKFQSRVGYVLAIGAFVYPCLTFTDTHLIDTVLFGQWTILIIILLLYTSYKPYKICFCLNNKMHYRR